MPRLALLCLVATLGAAASAQAPRFEATVPQGATLRVIESEPGAVTVEVTADWRTPLADAAERSRGDLGALFALATGGRPSISYEVGLAAAVPPAVTVLAAETDEVLLPPLLGDLTDALARPAAAVISVGERRRQLVGSLSIPLVRIEGDRLVRVRRLVARVPTPPVAARLAVAGDDNPHLAVERSVLADGTWFKVPIPESGVYRIDATFLRDSLGVENPAIQNVAIYGTGGRILPAVNSAPRPADLLEVPSLVQGDAVLFYAEGPQWWDWADGRWTHDISPFSDVSYYFVRVDAPSPRRVAGGTFPSWSDTQVLSTVAARRFYEVDLANIPRDGSGSGLDWLGPELAIGGSGFSVLDGRANPPVTITMAKGSQTLDTVRPFAISTSGTNTGNLANDAMLAGTAPLGDGLGVTFRATGGNAGATAWLDWVEAVVERPAAAESEGIVAFPTPGGQAGRFEVALTGFSQEPVVWDVTEPGAIRRLGVQAGGGGYRVRVEAGDRPREVVAFLPGGEHVMTPNGLDGGAVAVTNQNLHGIADFPDYIVVAHRDFLLQARRLADHRAADGLAPVVVTTEQVYNEFAGGAPDMRAVRDYVKFLYDRAPADRMPRYLLLFGDGHYDFRNIRSDVPNYVPAYETENMLSRTASFTSDDYFALMGDDEGEFEYFETGESNRVDLGVGRIPARSASDAATVVDKILRYESAATRGDWRTRFTFVADDQFPNSWDLDLHVLNADDVAELAQAVDPTVTLQKVYGPSYPAVINARGRVRPQAQEAIRDAINGGTLVWNYSGHGGPDGLGDEEYMTETLVNELTNADRLPVFVTATCSFGKFDIADEQSLAEQILLRRGGGGVAMLTTVRLVYTSSRPDSGLNFGLNLVLTEEMLRRDAQGRPSRLGDALYRTKNTDIGASRNNRKFNLLGDPAMRLGLPERSVALDVPSTFRAFEEATVSGEVLGLDGRPDASYRGEVAVTVFDAERLVELPADACCYTDGPDADGLGDYTARTDRIYAGRASVSGGRFSTTFLVPQDVSYSGLPARIVAYALGEDGSDGAGQSAEALVAADASARPDDGAGPEISLFLNDSTFVDGGETGPQGVLVARLSDASGINTVGAGVGHELLLTLDGDAADAVDVGRYYEGDLDTYRSGTVRVPLEALADGGLAPGPHTATLTAWDALNNPSTATVQFVVVDDGLVVESVLPYPNPTAGPARFFVAHNQPVGTEARVQLRIYTLAGRPVRTIDGAEALPGGFLSDRVVQIPWDGLDDDLDRLGSGVYLVRLRMETPDPAGGTRVAERVERLAIIR